MASIHQPHTPHPSSVGLCFLAGVVPGGRSDGSKYVIRVHSEKAQSPTFVFDSVRKRPSRTDLGYHTSSVMVASDWWKIRRMSTWHSLDFGEHNRRKDERRKNASHKDSFTSTSSSLTAATCIHLDIVVFPFRNAAASSKTRSIPSQRAVFSIKSHESTSTWIFVRDKAWAGCLPVFCWYPRRHHHTTKVDDLEWQMRIILTPTLSRKIPTTLLLLLTIFLRRKKNGYSPRSPE